VVHRGPWAHETVKAAIEAIPTQAWRTAIDSDGQPRDGRPGRRAHRLDARPGTGRAFWPQDWPDGMRVVVRRKRPHPGAQLRLTDPDGWRITCFAINTRDPGWSLAALEARHRDIEATARLGSGMDRAHDARRRITADSHAEHTATMTGGRSAIGLYLNCST
jgi:hypothetical protein